MIETNSGTLTIKELEKAEKVLFKISQKESFPEEYNNLLENKQIKTNSKLYKFSPFIHKNERKS